MCDAEISAAGARREARRIAKHFTYWRHQSYLLTKQIARVRESLASEQSASRKLREELRGVQGVLADTLRRTDTASDVSNVELRRARADVTESRAALAAETEKHARTAKLLIVAATEVDSLTGEVATNSAALEARDTEVAELQAERDELRRDLETAVMPVGSVGL